MTTKEQVPAKKPYEKPTLRIYGNVQAMTHSASLKAGRVDKSGFRKTG
jgi:hypothetical protein